MSNEVNNQEKIKSLTLQDLRRRARFDLFIVLKPGITSWFPHQKRAFCYRGDKFIKDEKRMLPSLIRLLIKKIECFETVELYDNDFHFQNDNRVILKITAGVVEINKLQNYSRLLTKVSLPVFLRP